MKKKIVDNAVRAGQIYPKTTFFRYCNVAELVLYFTDENFIFVLFR